MSHKNEAAALVAALQERGVRRLFTLSGNQILSIYDACLDADIELIHVRHEAAAVHMADAWGRLTGSPGVALLTAGPGHANGLSALYVAQQAESPLVLLSGASPQREGAFQQMAQVEIAAPLAKAAWLVGGNAEAHFHAAWELAVSGRPGPVHLTLPGDVLENCVQRNGIPSSSRGDPFEQADEIIDGLHGAQRPLVLCGPMFAGAIGEERLRQLRNALSAPVVAMESPRGINDPSLGAFAEMLSQADCVVLLGKRPDWSLKFGECFSTDCRMWQLEPDAAYSLAEAAAKKTWPTLAWVDEVQSAIQYRPPEWETFANDDAMGPMHPLFLCRQLQPWLEGDAVFISDGGEFGQWAQAALTARRRVINGPSGSIGGSIPFALAARLAFPDASIAVTLGDGTFGFHAMEFDTAVRYRLPFVAVVGADARWNAEYQLQLREYGPERTIGCELRPTRYDQVVQSLGGHGEHVTHPADLAPALKRAFASGLPACVNVAIQPAAAPIVRRV